MSVTVKKFGAEWCGPCRALKPVLETLKKEFEGKATFIEYDVDNSPEEAPLKLTVPLPLSVPFTTEEGLTSTKPKPPFAKSRALVIKHLFPLK